jgi:L-lysine 6-transaminase
MLHPMEDEGVLDSTWGGSLADMVRFVQELKIVREEKLIEAVPAKTTHLLARLHELQAEFPQKMSNIRGAGLYQGFSLSSPTQKAAFVENALQQQSLILLGAGRQSVRFRPNLNVTTADIDVLYTKLRRLLRQVD